MTKIALRYTGSDEAVKRRLEATDGVQYFEPVDAREILATPGNEYEPDEESRKLLGLRFDPRLKGLSVPQLQGADTELQTGLSHEKYARDQVVKSVPDAMQPTMMRPQTTTGRPLDLDAAREGAGNGQGDPRFGQPDGAVKLSEGLTKDEIKSELQSRGVEFDAKASKDELAELLDRQPR